MTSVVPVILAAGQGTRMKSALPKVLHPLAGRPMVEYAVATATAVSGQTPVLVVGHGADQVRAVVGGRAHCAVQEPQLGTGHAVVQARALVGPDAGTVLVTYADMPLISEDTLRTLFRSHTQNRSVLSMLTVRLPDPHGFGRVQRDATGAVNGVIEEAQCTPEQLAIQELNAGVYCFQADWLWENLPRLPLSPKGEYYLTDLVGMAAAQGLPLQAVLCPDTHEMLGINTRVHLAEAEAVLRERINRRWMEAGVTLQNPTCTYIDATVTIGPDTVILPNCYLQGQSAIGAGCRIGPDSLLRDSQVGDRTVVTMSVLEEAVMEEDASIGPFGHLRKGSRVCRGAHMGNFGELKNSTLGPGAKMGHFSYLGDATVGAEANIGCGTITCNFDGQHKHPTVIEENAFIGSDTMLVAPVHIGRGAKTGAGSVVTHDVPADGLAYGVPARVRRMLDSPSEEHAEE
jgi:bifunctional UDP-N-acetylglucosamine pyrophosphorylase / glucosamine-1-phosphate N-acetyltransferase